MESMRTGVKLRESKLGSTNNRERERKEMKGVGKGIYLFSSGLVKGDDDCDVILKDLFKTCTSRHR